MEAKPERPPLAFALGFGAGTAGGLIGLGGAEFRLPALLGPLRFAPREAIPINLLASLFVLAAALPARQAAVPIQAIGPHLVPLLGMLAGSVAAAWVGAGWIGRLPERLLALGIVGLLGALGLVFVAEGLLDQDPRDLVGERPVARAAVAVAAGLGIGLVSSLLGVAGGRAHRPGVHPGLRH